MIIPVKYRERLLETLRWGHSIEYTYQFDEIEELLAAGVLCRMRDRTQDHKTIILRVTPTARRVLLGLRPIHLKNKQPWDEDKKK